VSETEPEFSGDVKISPKGVEVGSDAELTFPQLIRLGIYHDLNDQFALLCTLGWEDWGALDNLAISTAKGSQNIPRNWHDTWHFSAGMHYRPAKSWLLQFGISYDTSPVDSGDRTPDMAIDRQVRYAFGVQYQWSKRLTFGGAFEYADYGDANINNSLLKGNYNPNDIFFFAFHINWKL
jgi:long-chain fatty acid transport protein